MYFLYIVYVFNFHSIAKYGSLIGQGFQLKIEKCFLLFISGDFNLLDRL